MELARNHSTVVPPVVSDWLGHSETLAQMVRPSDCHSEPSSIYNYDAVTCMYDGAAQYVLSAHNFTSKERDSESGLDNFGARYDSSQYGRFMSPDPENLGSIRDDPQS